MVHLFSSLLVLVRNQVCLVCSSTQTANNLFKLVVVMVPRTRRKLSQVSCTDQSQLNHHKTSSQVGQFVLFSAIFKIERHYLLGLEQGCYIWMEKTRNYSINSCPFNQWDFVPIQLEITLNNFAWYCRLAQLRAHKLDHRPKQATGTKSKLF